MDKSPEETLHDVLVWAVKNYPTQPDVGCKAALKKLLDEGGTPARAICELVPEREMMEMLRAHFRKVVDELGVRHPKGRK